MLVGANHHRLRLGKRDALAIPTARSFPNSTTHIGGDLLDAVVGFAARKGTLESAQLCAIRYEDFIHNRSPR